MFSDPWDSSILSGCCLRYTINTYFMYGVRVFNKSLFFYQNCPCFECVDLTNRKKISLLKQLNVQLRLTFFFWYTVCNQKILHQLEQRLPVQIFFLFLDLKKFKSIRINFLLGGILCALQEQGKLDFSFQFSILVAGYISRYT